MGLPFILIMGAVALFTIGGTGLGVYVYLQEVEQPQPADVARCFPKLNGEVFITIKGFEWFQRRCWRTCLPEEDVPGCRCYLKLSFDAGESVRWKVINSTEGLQDGWTTMEYHRLRDRNLKRLHVQFGHVKLVYALRFNSDLIAEVKPCELSETPLDMVDYEELDSGYKPPEKYVGKCGHITVQKIKEKYLKLRSCSPLGLWWDLDDVTPKE